MTAPAIALVITLAATAVVVAGVVRKRRARRAQVEATNASLAYLDAHVTTNVFVRDAHELAVLRREARRQGGALIRSAPVTSNGTPGYAASVSIPAQRA